jgi:hypothetical protein
LPLRHPFQWQPALLLGFAAAQPAYHHALSGLVVTDVPKVTLWELWYINGLFDASRYNALIIKDSLLSSLKHEFGRFGLPLEADAA